MIRHVLSMRCTQAEHEMSKPRQTRCSAKTSRHETSTGGVNQEVVNQISQHAMLMIAYLQLVSLATKAGKRSWTVKKWS